LIYHRLLAFLQRYGVITLIVVAFVALGILYSVTTPIFETPDEPWHYRYVKRLADGLGLPPLSMSGDPWQQGEAHQPPLYYALGAVLTSGIDTGPAAALYERNPYAATGLAHSPGNKNAVLHLDGEGYPYHGVSLAVHVLRWFSILCSALTVLLTYLLVLEIVPRRRVIAIGAAALVAFNPQFLFISAGANNDSLVSLLTTLTLYLSMRVCNGKAKPYSTPILLGASVGLGALTKLSGFLAGILVVVAYLFHLRNSRSRRIWEDLVRPVLIAMAVALGISGWWYARNAILYQDILGMKALSSAFGIRASELPFRDVLRVLVESVVSYWGVFGWMNVLADEVYYTLTRTFSILGTFGLILALVRAYWRHDTLRQYRWRTALLGVLWVLVMGASLSRWTQLITGPQGRLLFPAISAISFLLLIGFQAWFPGRYISVLTFILTVSLFGVSLIAPFRYIAPAYARPARIPLEQVPAGIQDLNVRFGDDLFLLGYELREDSLRPGGDLHLRLYWLALKAMSRDYAVYVHVFGRQGARIGGIDTFPGKGNYPTRLWVPGDVVADDYTLTVARDAEVPTAAILRVGIYNPPGVENLPVYDAQGREIGASPEIGRVRIVATKAARYQPQQELQVNLDHKVMLAGYDLAPQVPTAGEPWEVTLYWKALAPMPKDYTVFVHLVDDVGKMAAQFDQQPLGGDYPTHLWQMGETIKDVHQLPLPADLPAGEYRLNIGLYLLETGERLFVVDAAPPANMVTLGPAHIKGR
jgi:4-amino-4-deoxy-L-arabinose transferase-like glycosyltransferase